MVPRTLDVPDQQARLLGNLPWPAVGADIDSQQMANNQSMFKIPAQLRYEVIKGISSPEAPEQPGVIVDDSDAGFVTSGNWQEYTGKDRYYASTHRIPVDTGASAKATWNFTVISPGRYEVYAWWPSNDTRSSAVPYTVQHRDGSDTVTVDQKIDGSQWNLLGRFNFDSSAVIDLNSPADGNSAAADAIRLVKVTDTFNCRRECIRAYR